ncbi:MAG: hypothetical protein ABIU86_08855, partial [Gemmatimonadaceae bacterium]
LPQAASLVNVGLWLIMLGGLLKITRTARTTAPAAALCVAFLVHPFVMRVFSSAMADGYAVFVVYSIAAMLATTKDEARTEATLLGFACWIGAQSRYQLLAVALAGSILFVGMTVRYRGWAPLRNFLKGAGAAMVLCAPFYIANLTDFGNPFWPLFIPQINGAHTYGDRVASLYSASLVGQYDVGAFTVRLIELITTPLVLPLALILVLLVPVSALSRGDPRYRRVAILGSFILILWALAQPRLFPKHVILLLPLGPLLAVAAFEGRITGGVGRRLIDAALGAAIVTTLGASAVLSWDYIRYAVTGNRADYHRFTWYYPVYDWVNHNTPRDARFLVIAYSGHTYYLDRPYRRADPWLSGVVDWARVSSEEDLDRVVRAGRYDYLIYDDRDWSDFLGGSAMSSAVNSAMAAGTLMPVQEFRERLYSSRLFREFKETRVLVLRPRQDR